MTLQRLTEIVPLSLWNKTIYIDIPQLRPGDEGTYPLKHVDIGSERDEAIILLTDNESLS